MIASPMQIREFPYANTVETAPRFQVHDLRLMIPDGG
jgi:hypothetical protein